MTYTITLTREEIRLKVFEAFNNNALQACVREETEEPKYATGSAPCAIGVLLPKDVGKRFDEMIDKDTGKALNPNVSYLHGAGLLRFEHPSALPYAIYLQHLHDNAVNAMVHEWEYSLGSFGAFIATESQLWTKCNHE